MMNQFDYDCYTCDCYDRDAEQCTMPSIDKDYACPIYANNYVRDIELEYERQDKEEDMNNDGQRNL